MQSQHAYAWGAEREKKGVCEPQAAIQTLHCVGAATALAPKCHKCAVKHVCGDSGAGHAGTRIRIGLFPQDPIPASLRPGKFALARANQHRGWEKVVGGWNKRGRAL